MKRAYVVELTSRPIEDLSNEALEAFARDRLRRAGAHGIAPAADLATHTLSARMTLEAESPEAALEAGVRIFTRPQLKGLEDLDVGEARVSLELDGADRDELVASADIARRLGVTRQRVWQMVSQKGRFPAPLATFGTVSVWRWGDVADWAEVNARKVTRRRKKVS